MDSEALQARSIELAERAYRQKARAEHTNLYQHLDNVADELIILDNPDRFYVAGSRLEAAKEWTEELRALAHEINVADQTLRGISPILTQDTLATVEQWTGKFLESSSEGLRKHGQIINQALKAYDSQDQTRQKSTLNLLLMELESILSHLARDNVEEVVLTLRNMRDSILSARFLLHDEHELIADDQDENKQVDGIELARDTLDEIYQQIKPAEMPKLD